MAIGLVMVRKNVFWENRYLIMSHRQTDRQTVKQIQATRLKLRHTGRQAGRQAGRQTDKKTDRLTKFVFANQSLVMGQRNVFWDTGYLNISHRQTDKKTESHTDRQADRQTNKICIRN